MKLHSLLAPVFLLMGLAATPALAGEPGGMDLSSFAGANSRSVAVAGVNNIVVPNTGGNGGGVQTILAAPPVPGALFGQGGNPCATGWNVGITGPGAGIGLGKATDSDRCREIQTGHEFLAAGNVYHDARAQSMGYWMMCRQDEETQKACAALGLVGGGSQQTKTAMAYVPMQAQPVYSPAPAAVMPQQTRLVSADGFALPEEGCPTLEQRALTHVPGQKARAKYFMTGCRFPKRVWDP